MVPPSDPIGRRPLTTRQAGWARALAAALARRRVRPNAISLASMACAALAGAALAAWPRVPPAWVPAVLIAACAGIQLRLLANMLDGMVAIEGGLRSPVGDLYNEVPDRIADGLILAGAGYGLAALPHGIELGWAATAMALLTAYVRALGGQVGVPARFEGPMAKPHRMATLTVAALAAAIAAPWRAELVGWLLWSALALVVVGAAITVARRLTRIARALRERPA
jgi:phosphatidylglycerophosphate synthase